MTSSAPIAEIAPSCKFNLSKAVVGTTMDRSYKDIISRISQPPVWWQMGGIPRFDAFDPNKSTGVYVSEAALVEIACSITGVRFVVLFEGGADRKVASQIRDRTLFYGDPPNVPEVTPHSGAETIRVLQYWYTNHSEYVSNGQIFDWKGYSEWKRDPALEITFPGAEQVANAGFWEPTDDWRCA